MKRGWVVIAVTLIVSVLALGFGCAKPAPATSAPPPPPPKTTAPPVAPAPPTKPAAAKPAAPPAQKTQITILSRDVGTSSYALLFGLAEQIKKRSTWLQATPIETTSAAENIKTATRDDKSKKSMIMQVDGGWWTSRAGLPPFTQKYAPPVIAKLVDFYSVFITLDPGVKTWEDLKGKRISLGTKGSQAETVLTRVLKLHGAYNESLVSYLAYDKTKDALLDGRIVAASVALTSLNPFVPNPAMLEMFQSGKTIYTIPFLDADLPALLKGMVSPFDLVKIPKGRDAMVKEDWVTLGGNAFIAADTAMDSNIVYEVARILNENIKEFGAYHATAKGWTSQGFVEARVEREYFHPGALKYWDEKGLKITWKDPEGLVK